MLKIRVSSKRQATFPKHVCDALGIQPGDELVLDRREDADGEAWLLRPSKTNERPWFGALSDFARGKSHEMDEIRSSVASARRASK